MTDMIVAMAEFNKFVASSQDNPSVLAMANHLIDMADGISIVKSDGTPSKSFMDVVRKIMLTYGWGFSPAAYVLMRHARALNQL